MAKTADTLVYRASDEYRLYNMKESSPTVADVKPSPEPSPLRPNRPSKVLPDSESRQETDQSRVINVAHPIAFDARR